MRDAADGAHPTHRARATVSRRAAPRMAAPNTLSIMSDPCAPTVAGPLREPHEMRVREPDRRVAPSDALRGSIRPAGPTGGKKPGGDRSGASRIPERAEHQGRPIPTQGLDGPGCCFELLLAGY